MRTLLALPLAVSAVLLAGCGGESESASEPPAPESFDVSITVQATIDATALISTIYDMSAGEDVVRGETPCQSSLPGVAPGTQLTIADADGTTLGVGELGKGVIGGSGQKAPIDSPCTFSVEIADIEGDSDFYELSVGTIATATVPAEDVQDPEFVFNLT